MIRRAGQEIYCLLAPGDAGRYHEFARQLLANLAELVMSPNDYPCEMVDAPAASSTLLSIVALIERDAAASPAEYLEETVVPHGGE